MIFFLNFWDFEENAIGGQSIKAFKTSSSEFSNIFQNLLNLILNEREKDDSEKTEMKCFFFL